GVHHYEPVRVVAPDQRLLGTDRQVSILKEAFMKFLQHLVLQGLVEVNHDVAAQDQVELVERFAQYEVMTTKTHVLHEGRIEDGRTIFNPIVLLQRTGSLEAYVVFLVEIHILHRVACSACTVENVHIKIGSDDVDVVKNAHLFQKYAHRQNFFARRTSRVPYLELLMIEEDRGYDFFAHDPPEAGIAKHFRNVDGELVEKFIDERRLLTEFAEQRLNCEALDLHDSQDPPFEGGHSIVSEVVTVLLVYKLRYPF